MVVAASLRTGLDAVRQIERVDPDRCRARHRNAGSRRHFRACRCCWQKRPNLIIIMARDADPPQQRRSARQGNYSLGASDYIPKPERHPRADRRRNLSPRSHSENPPSRRQGPARASRLQPVRHWRRSSSGRVSRCRGRRGPRRRFAIAAPARSVHKPRARPDRFIDRGPQALMTLRQRDGAVNRSLPVLSRNIMPPNLHHDSGGTSGALEPPAGA